VNARENLNVAKVKDVGEVAKVFVFYTYHQNPLLKPLIHLQLLQRLE
jgi:hypothetical protein